MFDGKMSTQFSNLLQSSKIFSTGTWKLKETIIVNNELLNFKFPKFDTISKRITDIV